MPIVIGIAQELKIDILSLAIPVALCINVCWSLPFNAKPNAMLYGTNKYTMGESFYYGFVMSFSLLVRFTACGSNIFQMARHHSRHSSNEIMIRCAAKFPKTLRHDVFPSSLVGLFCRRTHAHRRD